MSRLAAVLQPFRRPFAMLRRHWLLVTTGMLCVPLHAAVLLWMPRLMGSAIDSLAPPGDGGAAPGAADALATTCLVLVGLALAESGLRYVSRRTLIDASRHVEEALKNEVLHHMQRLPIAWFDRARTGDLVSRMTQDVELVRFVMGPLLLHGGNALCVLPGGVWLMAQMSVPVTLASTAVFAALFAFLRVLLPRLQHWSKKAQEAVGDLSQRVQEDFAGIRVLKQFGAESRELAALARRNRRSLAFNLRLVRLRSTMNATTHSITGAVLLGVLLVGGHQVIAGELTIGELFQFTVYLGMMTFPLEVLGWTLATMPRAIAAAQRVEEIFAVAPEPQTGERPELTGRLSVRNLTFTYEGRQEPALRDVSFDLEPGRKLGLVGPVGSGKSTLLALLLRFYAPQAGRIEIDGIPLAQIGDAHFRADVGLVPQEPFLLAADARENIDMGRGLPDDVIEAAARAARAHDFIARLERGYATPLGEGGARLSAGEKQLVAVARALAGRPRILFLDEATSRIDSETEQRVQEALAELRGRTTVIAIAHRLSTIRAADEIVVLNHGRVAERGTHEALLAIPGGIYQRLWQLQQIGD